MTNTSELQSADTTPDVDQMPETWHIVQRSEGHCDIVVTPVEPGQPMDDLKKWGPFTSRGEAIAKRVGLIRAGKCLPQ